MEKDLILKSDATAKKKYCIFVFYQNGVRNDVINILKELNEQNVSVLLISNKKLSEYQKEILNKYADVIISRRNYGRDFGAYKRGMEYIYKNIDLDSIDKLILLNDSVFYSLKGLNKFVNDLLDVKYEIIGATENYEYAKHIGSFCISMSRDIVKNSRVIKYWRKYKNTDLRPQVIAGGEIEFSRVLFSISNPSSVKILYSYYTVYSSWASGVLNANNMFNYIRDSKEPSDWKTFDFTTAVSDFIKEKMLPINLNSQFQPKSRIALKNFEVDTTCCISSAGALDLLNNHTHKIEDLESKYNDYMMNKLLDLIIGGGQIHQNNIMFYYLGMPIIKNDCFFRGIFNRADLNKMCSLLPADEVELFLSIQFSKPYGSEFLKKNSFDYYAMINGYL